jgi:MFS family permease
MSSSTTALNDSNLPSEPPAPPHRRLGVTYWTCNIIEMWERLAYYMFRPVAPVYIAQADDPGGLHLTQAAKGVIYMWWALFQSLLPTFTGGLADRYGYRKSLTLGLSMNLVGYLMIAYVRSYVGFFAGVLVLATGTAFFKPGLQGTLAHCLTRETSSLGWGIFYWIVNVGSFIGHMLATFLLGNPHSVGSWRLMFLVCAGCTAVNLATLSVFPDIPSGASKTESPFSVVVRTVKNAVEPRLLAFLLIMSCFWMMMYQLWDLQPNFISDWVDSSSVARYLPERWIESTPNGRPRVAQQILLSLNAFLIVFLVVPISYVVRRMRTLQAMLFGMLGATAGLLIAGLTMNGWVLLLGIVFFSLGEMLTGPKKPEYLGLIAPPGKKGLYLGYVNIPVGLGAGFGGLLAGHVYGHYGEKATLAMKYLLSHTDYVKDKAWDGSLDSLAAVVGVDRTHAFAKLQEVLGIDAVQATQLLWDTYHPQYATWIPFAITGFVATIALYIFGRMARRWSDMDA